MHTDSGGPTLIGADVTVGHNAVVHGCTIEDKCLIGIGSIILGQAHVKRGSVVAAGSLVRRSQVVGPHHLVAGSPAVYKKTLPESGYELIDRPVRNYLRHSREHQGAHRIDGASN